MSEALAWWSQFRKGLLAGGFRECEETPSKAHHYIFDGGEVACPGKGCSLMPEYHDFLRGEEYLAFIVCPECGGVWGAEKLERFH